MSYTVNHSPPFLVFTINRPRVRNAIDFDVMGGLEDALDVLEKDGRYRALILTGAGSEAFASGGDLRKFAGLKTRESVGMMALRMQMILERIEAVEVWTIAAVNGAAYGGGGELTLACDFRLASESAVFGFTQVNFAVPPGWGGLVRLVETVGKPTALRWLAEGAIVDAKTALAANLVHEVVPGDLLAAVKSFASRMVAHDRKLIGALKTGMRSAHTLPHREAVQAELGPFVECWLGEEHQLRIESFLERTK